MNPYNPQPPSAAEIWLCVIAMTACICIIYLAGVYEGREQLREQVARSEYCKQPFSNETLCYRSSDD